MPRKNKKKEPFEFLYNKKRYLIHEPYEGKATFLVLSDGFLFYVRSWKISLPFEAVADGEITPFNPQEQEPAAVAQTVGGFVAELQPDPAKPA